MCSIIFESTVLVIYLYLPIDHHCIIRSELSDPLEKDRIACTSPTVISPGIVHQQHCQETNDNMPHQGMSVRWLIHEHQLMYTTARSIWYKYPSFLPLLLLKPGSHTVNISFMTAILGTATNLYLDHYYLVYWLHQIVKVLTTEVQNETWTM